MSVPFVTRSALKHRATWRRSANRWLEVLWHCLRKDVLYDETIHAANRQKTRAVKPAAWG